MSLFDFTDLPQIVHSLEAQPHGGALKRSHAPDVNAFEHEQQLTPLRDGEVARLHPLQIQPVELASEGLIRLWREAGRSDLVTILLPDAIRTLGAIIRDPYAPASARVSACKTVIGEALAERNADGAKKALHEMTADEINAALGALYVLEGQRVEPPNAPIETDILDAWFTE